MAYTMSTGDKSTVGNWIKLASAVFGPESKQVEFLRTKITTKNGLDEEIIADESQLLFVLMSLEQ